MHSVTIPSPSSDHEAARLLTQPHGVLRPRASALVLWEVKPQRVVSYGLGDVSKVLHQVSTQRTVQ